MEQRIKFKKGEQRKFLKRVINNLNCESLRGILQFGFDMPYSTLKNYYVERRLLPKSLYLNLCRISKIDSQEFKVKYYESNWGMVKGGKIKIII
jgi:hypothetical protein